LGSLFKWYARLNDKVMNTTSITLFKTSSGLSPALLSCLPCHCPQAEDGRQIVALLSEFYSAQIPPQRRKDIGREASHFVSPDKFGLEL
jgi:hypothetical protein